VLQSYRIRQIRDQKMMSHNSSFVSQSSSYYSSNQASLSKDRQAVTSKLRAMGYKDDIPLDVLDEFLEELRSAEHSSYDTDGQHSSCTSESAENDFNSQQSSSQRDIESSGVDESYPEPDVNEISKALKSLDLSNLKKVVQQQKQKVAELQRYQEQMNHDQYSESSSRPQSSRKINVDLLKPRRRNDPVTRYHELKSVWDSDSFLKRVGDLNGNTKSRGMLGLKSASKPPNTGMGNQARKTK
jgi:hypothetical protein